MIILYKGRRGAGKTLSMVKDGLQYHGEGLKVYSNSFCPFAKDISNDKILNLDKFSKIKNCVLMVDEIQIFFDARRSTTKENVKFSNFIQQIRKRNIILLATTQFANTIDLRFRQHVDIIALPNFIKELEVCEIVYVDVTSTEDIFSTEGIKEPRLVKMVYDAKPIFKLYQTEQLIS